MGNEIKIGRQVVVERYFPEGDRIGIVMDVPEHGMVRVKIDINEEYKVPKKYVKVLGD